MSIYETMQKLKHRDTLTLVEIWNSIQDRTEKRYIFDMDEFDTITTVLTRSQIADSVHRSYHRFNPSDDWFRKYPTGMLESWTSRQVKEYIIMELEEMWTQATDYWMVELCEAIEDVLYDYDLL